MAKIVQIPFSFEFRTTTVEWSMGNARITGWAKRPNTVMWANHPDAKVDGAALIAEVTTDDGTYAVKYPRQNLPAGKWDDLWMQAYTDQDVERVFSDWKPMLLIPSGKIHKDEAEFRKNSQPAKAWDLRDDFLQLKPNYEAAKAFLSKWGRWNNSDFIELGEVLQFQEAIRQALISPAANWFASTMSIPPLGRPIQEFPYFGFLTDLCEVALRLTVTIDLIRDVKFKLCARPDCGQPFAITSKHQKSYCSEQCGHLELVRRKRKEKQH